MPQGKMTCRENIKEDKNKTTASKFMETIKAKPNDLSSAFKAQGQREKKM